MHFTRVSPALAVSVWWYFCLFTMLGWGGNLSMANGQIQYGAPVTPLSAATDPMIQGPVPSFGADVYGTPIYGAPVSSEPVPSFWQTNPAPAAPPSDVLDGTTLEEATIEGLDGVEPIVDAIVEPAAEDLVEDVPPYEPVWYNPTSWIGPAWDGSIEVGLNGSSGNSDARSIRTGFDLSRETARANWEVDLTYNKNESNGVETQHNALFGSNWDFKMSNPRWTWFTKFGLEYDEFKNFDLRLSLNTGLGYALIDTDRTKFRPRFGSGTSREFGGIDEEWHPEAVFGLDFSL